MRSQVTAAATNQRRDEPSSSDSDHESDDDRAASQPSAHSHAKMSGTWLQQRRMAVAQEIKRDREQRVQNLHEARHHVDYCFSFLMGNLAIVSVVLGVVYSQRACDKPLAAFLVILGCLAPFAACTPILVRQWLYLHVRCNLVTMGVFFMTLLSMVWLLVGQQWAFESSATTCDEELSTAANAVVFLMFVATLAYIAKIAWYLLLRARYSYSALWRSCWCDPYPNALAVSDADFLALEAIVVSAPPLAASVHATHAAT